MDAQPNYCVYILKFQVFEHGMPRALRINSNGGLRQGHVESCSLTNISPLPQCLWLPNLVGW